MIKGGYKIVNFNGATLSGTEVTLAGIYDQIVDDYDKPIMVSGVILSGELQDDAYASVKVNDGSVDLYVYGGVITVTDDDEVSFAVSKTPAELTAEIGDLDDLTTTDKDSAVDAINEVNSKVGDLDDLETTDKDSLVDAINEVKNGSVKVTANINVAVGSTTAGSNYELGTVSDMIPSGAAAVAPLFINAYGSDAYDYTTLTIVNNKVVFRATVTQSSVGVNFRMLYI